MARVCGVAVRHRSRHCALRAGRPLQSVTSRVRRLPAPVARRQAPRLPLAHPHLWVPKTRRTYQPADERTVLTRRAAHNGDATH